MKQPIPIERTGFRGETEVFLAPQVGYNYEADLARTLLLHLAIATGLPDGEDSGGRQKLKLMPPAEVAQRACDIAHCALREFEARGWMIEMPLPKPPKTKEEL